MTGRSPRRPRYPGIETIPLPSLPALASDATREDLAAFLAVLALTTRHPRLRAIAAREGKPLGGRPKVDLGGQLARLDWLLAEKIGRTIEQAARYAVREAGVPTSEEGRAVRRLLRAYRARRRE